jgi:hypothetical protein
VPRSLSSLRLKATPLSTAKTRGFEVTLEMSTLPGFASL